ncbi:Transposase DDE domain protein [Leptospira kirschneri serovar Mozdok]|nr:Transposase DDE domain protein [Leptospira kirschneri serovar Mozdok]
MNRRSAIEPVISHLKHDHNMVRNFLKGKEGGIVSMRSYPLLGLISLSSFKLFFVISKILSLHRFYFQFESCFFSFRQKSQFFRDDYTKTLHIEGNQIQVSFTVLNCI